MLQQKDLLQSETNSGLRVLDDDTGSIRTEKSEA